MLPASPAPPPPDDELPAPAADMLAALLANESIGGTTALQRRSTFRRSAILLFVWIFNWLYQTTKMTTTHSTTRYNQQHGRQSKFLETMPKDTINSINLRVRLMHLESHTHTHTHTCTIHRSCNNKMDEWHIHSLCAGVQSFFLFFLYKYLAWTWRGFYLTTRSELSVLVDKSFQSWEQRRTCIERDGLSTTNTEKTSSPPQSHTRALHYKPSRAWTIVAPIADETQSGEKQDAVFCPFFCFDIKHRVVINSNLFVSQESHGKCGLFSISQKSPNLCVCSCLEKLTGFR